MRMTQYTSGPKHIKLEDNKWITRVWKARVWWVHLNRHWTTPADCELSLVKLLERSKAGFE